MAVPRSNTIRSLAAVLAAMALATAACSATPGRSASGQPSGSTSAQSGQPDLSASDLPSESMPESTPPTTLPTTARLSSCTKVKIVGARGTGEAPGLGYLLSQVAKRIDSAVSKPVTSVGLNYPASSDFTNSSRAGTTELKRVIAAETSACLVVMGYSQGAIVVGDALAAVGASGGKRIAAVIMFGDPRFNSAEPYNAGTYAKGRGGVYPRPTGQLSAFKTRIRNYCNGGDTVCQGSGASGSGGHGDYGQYAADAAKFVAARV